MGLELNLKGRTNENLFELEMGKIRIGTQKNSTL
jgi:hypothetical protein